MKLFHVVIGLLLLSGFVILVVIMKNYSQNKFISQIVTKENNTTVELLGSCSQNPSCIDKIKSSNGMISKANQTEDLEIINKMKNDFDDQINATFGLIKTDYELSCLECAKFGESFYKFKAKGVYHNTSEFEVFLGTRHSVPCPHGGMDCGSQICFQTEDKILFKKIKEHSCNKLLNNAYTASLRNDCLNGSFDSYKNDNALFSLLDPSDRMDILPIKSNTTCLLLDLY